ncbi:MAG: alanine--tRNA ligase [Candidatus Coatesbacteria bacterium RBG_13_66_14]|uniref:Alanine--tRNA ligase n=1 Tax=Candidatus Coatesbacteria bacterium RBG_13_66_14 TaxID=1817816 RepID=A0A1F5F4K5_9BACT|nr:MAG: alanine--tRNA ligase [Candidatus Coatesbacteria bacterium RBG_13_66_14]
MPTSHEIKRTYLDFFVQRGHTEVPSAPLAPRDDPSLLFNSAGMVQFKPYWAGTVPVPFSPARACSLQKCFRMTDLENVGRTPRHHTFFEMLGNFSFGDYFKEEAIRWAWELSVDVYGMDPERIHAAVFTDDDEAHRLWREIIGLPAERVIRLGAEDNFWGPAGKTGACGPSSELYWDNGPKRGCGRPDCRPGCACERFVEYWNLVFPQFDMQPDGTLAPLKNRGIDTGLGVDRLTAILQGKAGDYDTDLFRPIIEATAVIVGRDPDDPAVRPKLWAVADHARALTVTLAEGVIPSNTGRGYALRRLLRRAGRLGFELGVEEPFVYRLVDPVNDVLGLSYPEMLPRAERTKEAICREEERFLGTLAAGMEVFSGIVGNLSGKIISGRDAFKLYDTFGFPVDLTAVMAEERGLSVDLDGFEGELEAARETSRASARFHSGDGGPTVTGLESIFRGYDALELESRVVALFDAGHEPVDALETGAEGTVVLDETPFYAESGGQVGDTGELTTDSGAVFKVADTRKAGLAHLHTGTIKTGSLNVGETVRAAVDESRRRRIQAHHTATHVLHWALRKVLGEHAVQAGSWVGPDYFRFDLNHPRAVSENELEEITRLVNGKILENDPVRWRIVTLDEAKRLGAMMLFGEKYSGEVRLVETGDFSKELCGGTHARATGEIGSLYVVQEGALAAGIRRIEAVCGMAAVEHMNRREGLLNRAASLVKVPPAELPGRVETLLEDRRTAEKKIIELEERLAAGGSRNLANEAEVIDGVRLLAAELPGVGAKALRGTVDRLKEELGSAVILLATRDGDKAVLACGVTADLVERLHAGKLMGELAPLLGGQGGGRPDFAQGGGIFPDKLPLVFAKIRELVGGGR